MLRHIVTWNYKEGVAEGENKENALKVKFDLEALKHYIDEIIDIKVHINNLSSSTKDIMLDSLFENEETLAAYKVHPEHIKVSNFIGCVLQDRASFDYYE